MGVTRAYIAINRLFVAAFLTAMLGISGLTETVNADNFVRGDVNADGRISMNDLVCIVDGLFMDGTIGCPDTADLDDNGTLDIVDVYVMLDFLYHGWGAALPDPYPDSGDDPTDDDLGTCLLPGVDLEGGFVIDPVYYLALDGKGAAGLAIELSQRTIRVPIYLDTQADLVGYTISVAIDRDQVVDAELDFSNSIAAEVGADDWSSTLISTDDSDHVLGYALLVLRYDDEETVSFADGEEYLAAELVLELAEGLAVGTQIDIRFEATPAIEDAPEVINEVVADGLLSAEPTTHDFQIPVVRAEQMFVRGDVNRDGSTSILDALVLLDFLFSDDMSLECADAADYDDDGHLGLIDPLRTLAYLFLNDVPPSDPYPYRGIDTTDDFLECEEFEELGLGTGTIDPHDGQGR